MIAWTEADEVAANMAVDLSEIRTFDDALHLCPPAEEVGYQVRDNMAEALLRRAKDARDGMNMKPKKTLSERIAEADERGSRYLADANEAAEAGKKDKAEKLYEKGQFWLDRSNKLRGNG